jgi:hypothetical protein
VHDGAEKATQICHTCLSNQILYTTLFNHGVASLGEALEVACTVPV